MTLPNLCELNKATKDIYVQNANLSQFYHDIPNTDYKSIIGEFTSRDLEGLSLYCKCEIISIYEYICGKEDIPINTTIKDISKGLVCPMQENVFYLCNKDLTGNSVYAEEEYKKALAKSIEPFKSYGVIVSEFNFAV